MCGLGCFSALSAPGFLSGLGNTVGSGLALTSWSLDEGAGANVLCAGVTAGTQDHDSRDMIYASTPLQNQRKLVNSFINGFVFLLLSDTGHVLCASIDQHCVTLARVGTGT